MGRGAGTNDLGWDGSAGPAGSVNWNAWSWCLLVPAAGAVDPEGYKRASCPSACLCFPFTFSACILASQKAPTLSLIKTWPSAPVPLTAKEGPGADLSASLLRRGNVVVMCLKSGDLGCLGRRSGSMFPRKSWSWLDVVPLGYELAGLEGPPGLDGGGPILWLLKEGARMLQWWFEQHLIVDTLHRPHLGDT